MLISVFWKYKNLAILGFCLLFFTLGIWRYQNFELKIINNELIRFNNLKETVTLIGVVTTEPDIREKTQKLNIKIEQLIACFKNKVWGNCSETKSREDWGEVLVSTWRYPQYQYGDKLEIKGELETPPIFEDFNYRDYLKKEGIFSVMNFPEIKIIGKNFGNPAIKILFSFKNKFKEISESFIPPPQVGILEALTFGDESEISKEWKEKLNITGTRHIAAVSGMNVTIICFLIFSFALSIGLWRQQAFYLSLFLLVLYILMIGAPSSAVRAGIMGGLVMIAQYLGRISSADRAVIFAAALMLLINPLLLKLDVGFQLSFLAILGLIYFQPLLFNWFKILPNPKIFPIKTTLSATLSAQIFTLPILIYNFGIIPLVSPITNVLIVPFLAPTTILIFIFGISGMIFWFLGWIFSLPVWFLLSYITKIVDLFSQPSFISLSLKNVHWVFLLISYLILGFIIWRLQKNFTYPKFLQ